MGAMGSFKGARSRLGQESGFTIVETMAATMILMVAVLATGYAVSSGFVSSMKAREKQQASAIMNRAMEETEALGEDDLLLGMKTSDLCTNDGGRITGCGTATPTYGGMPIVHSSAPPDSVLSPHVSGPQAMGNTEFTRYAFLTYWGGDTSGSRVLLTVIVTWGGGSVSENKVLETRTGCAIDSLHPGGGPCSPLLDAAGDIPQGDIVVANPGTSGTAPMDGSTDNKFTLYVPELAAEVQSEQASVVTGAAVSSGFMLDFESGTGQNLGMYQAACGAYSVASAASDAAASDPRNDTAPTTTPPAQETMCQTITAGNPATVSSTYSASTLVFPLNAASGPRVIATKSTSDLPAYPRSYSTTVAGTYTCNGEANLLPCAFDTLRLGGSVHLNLQDAGATMTQANGSCTIAQATNEPSASSLFVTKRVSGGNSLVRVVYTRRFPDIYLGCIPTGMTTLPAAWTNFHTTSGHTDPISGTLRGYYFKLANYVETITLEAGPGGSSGTPTASRSGSIVYWDAATNAYQTTTISSALTSVSIPALDTGCVIQASGRAQVSYSSSNSAAAALAWSIPAPTVTKDTASGSPANLETVSFPDPLGGAVFYGTVKAAASNCNTVRSNVKISADLGRGTAEASYG